MIEIAGVLLDPRRVEAVMPATSNFAGDWTKILLRSGEWVQVNAPYDRVKTAILRAAGR